MKKFKRIAALLTVVSMYFTCTAFAQTSEENIDIQNPEVIEEAEVQVVIKNEAVVIVQYFSQISMVNANDSKEDRD